MDAEARTPTWVVLLGVLLLTSGCVTLSPRLVGSPLGDPRGFSAWRETAARALPPETASPEPHHLQRKVDIRPTSRGDEAAPPGWPDYSSGDKEALLAPFLRCASPAEFLALQERVDMPRLLEALDDWRAVRLAAQGPPREDAAHLFNRKRASFLVDAVEDHGVVRAQVLALFIVNSAHDDDLREILFLLAQDKRLEETIELLPAFRRALETRGLKPTARVDRNFELSDLGRGLARAGRDALSNSPMSDGGRGFAFTSIRDQLPPEYQEVLDEAEKRWAEQHFSAGHVVLGGFDHLTFGVPLGFYGLLAGTGQDGELLDIRRGSLKHLLPEGRAVRVSRVRFVYEGGNLKPTNKDYLDKVMNRTQSSVPGVEVLVQ